MKVKVGIELEIILINISFTGDTMKGYFNYMREKYG